MSSKKMPINAQEEWWILAVKTLPCACCGGPGPSHAHHVRVQGNRIGHFCVIPLCDPCHIPPSGVHGDKRLMLIRKLDEFGMLNATIKAVAAGIRDGRLAPGRRPVC